LKGILREVRGMLGIVVNGNWIFVDEARSLLEGCLRNGVDIPNLCFLEEMLDPPASCRMCFVEIEGQGQPLMACKVRPWAGMVVRTDTDQVRRLQQTALRLLLTVHEARCKPCPSNKRCDLQRLVRLLGVRIRPKRYEHLDRTVEEVEEHPVLEIYHPRCILCSKCIEVCRNRNGYSLLTFARRGIDTFIAAMGENGEEKPVCEECLACVEVCPVSAILIRSSSVEADEPALEQEAEASV
jgi:bidirectional [NiFe] hydrogenase diaphorase subunit